MFGIGDRLADRDVRDPGEADDVAGERFGDLDALQPFEREQLGDPGRLRRAVELENDDRIVDGDTAVEDAADGDPAEVVARIEIRDQHLQRRLGIAARRRHVIDDGVEERPQVLAGHREIA